MAKYSSDIEELESSLRAQSVAKDAPAMKAYMKDHFEFIGVKSVARKTASKDFMNKQLSSKSLKATLVKELWNSPYRELQYVAMDYLVRTKRFWQPAHLDLFKELIVRKSWWDTVDFLASNCIGRIIQKYPDLELEMDNWNRSDNIWLIRTSILCQLKYKDQVDKERLSRFILSHADSREFFLQKASGWALRQYAKFNPDWVKGFVERNALSSLTKKEALKHIG